MLTAMRHSLPSSPLRLLVSLVVLLNLASAQRLIESKSLNPCQENSSFSASLFNVLFTPDNTSLAFNIVGVSDISGNVTAELQVIAYGHKFMSQVIDPCARGEDLAGLCPMNRGQINIDSNLELSEEVINQVPSITYTIPDLDGKVRIYINDTDTGESVACLEAELSNGKTVYQKAVGWSVAIIAGLGLVASAITSGLGHSNTAAHVASNAMSLFGFFQAQAMLGMTSVDLPPLPGSWTQNFQWSMGIIRISFLQRFATWYQRATGGTPSKVLSSLSTTSVQVQKRSLEVVQKLVVRAYMDLTKRTNNNLPNSETSRSVTVHGIERVGFRSNIELTNIFMTGYSIFIVFVLIVVLGVLLFKGVCDALAKSGKLRGEKFQDFRNGWTTVLKGILFRIVLIGYTQMCVLCFWELTKRDSAAEVVLAIFTILAMISVLGWAASKVIRLAKRSIQLHKNPAYILYSDPVSLNKWGFLYVQFKASSYYFIVPILGYLLVKGMFIGLGQGNGVVQAIALVLLEAGFLVLISIMRPFMDKKTNAFNISIAAINFVGAIFLLFFTEIFNQPGIVTGVMGVVFFVYNAAFALILLLMVLVSSVYALISKNPDARYQPMRDDRGSFIKSQTTLTTELDALGATARGDKTAYKGRGIDDDDDSFSSGSLANNKAAEGALSPGYQYARDPPRSPVDPSVPLFPSDGASAGRHGPPPSYFRDGRTHSPASSYGGYGQVPYSQQQQQQQYGRTESLRSNGGQYRQQNSGSPWQRGAGYD